MNQPDKIAAEPSTVAITHILRKRKRFLAVAIAVGAGITVAFSLTMPHTYGSAASLMPPEQRGGGGLASLLQNAAPGLSLSLGDGKGQAVSADIIASNSLAERIIEYLHLDKHPKFAELTPALRIRSVKNSLEVETKRTSGVVYIHCSRVTSWLPGDAEQQEAKQLATDISNAAVLCLDAMLREKTVSTARKTREFIERIIAAKSAERDSLYAEMERFQKQNKIIGIEEQTSAIVTAAVDIGSELAKMQVELQLARQIYQPGSPIVRQYEQQLAALTKQYNQTQSGGLVPSDKFSISLDKFPALTRRYLNLQRDLKIAEQVNAYLQTQKLQESIQEARDVPVIQVLDKATIPLERDSPKRSVMVLLGTVLSMGLASLWVFFSEVYLHHPAEKDLKQE